MDRNMAILEVCILLLLTVTSLSAADRKDKYGLRGGSIELPVDPSLPKGTEVTSIIWKHGMNKAAEWFRGDENVSYFALFKLSTEVSMTTWALKISNLEEKYSGTYSSEVNNKEPTMLLILKVIGPVSKPVINGCNDDSHNNCTLTCKGTGDGPLTYTWIEGGNEKSSGAMLVVQKKDQDVIYTCKLSNPVSQENTSVEVRKIVPEVRFDSGPVIGLCIFLLCVAIILFIPCIVWIAKGNHRRDFTMQNWRQAWTTCPPCFYGRIEHSAVNGNTGSKGTDEERAVPCVCDGTATPLLSTEGAGDHPTGDTQSGAEPSEKPTATGQAEGAGDHPTGDTQSGAEPSENPTATGQERKGDQPSQDMQSGAEPFENPTATGQERKGDQPSQDMQSGAEPSENPTVAGQEATKDAGTDVSIL